MPVVLGLGAAFGAWQGVFEVTGGRLRGWNTAEVDEADFEGKVAQRAAKRRPIEETIAELGEGRGMFTFWSTGLDIPRRADALQVSGRRATRSGDVSGSRRSTVLRSTPLRQLSSKTKSNETSRPSPQPPIHHPAQRGMLFYFPLLVHIHSLRNTWAHEEESHRLEEMENCTIFFSCSLSFRVMCACLQ